MASVISDCSDLYPYWTVTGEAPDSPQPIGIGASAVFVYVIYFYVYTLLLHVLGRTKRSRTLYVYDAPFTTNVIFKTARAAIAGDDDDAICGGDDGSWWLFGLLRRCWLRRMCVVFREAAR